MWKIENVYKISVQIIQTLVFTQTIAIWKPWNNLAGPPQNFPSSTKDISSKISVQENDCTFQKIMDLEVRRDGQSHEELLESVRKAAKYSVKTGG